MDTQAYELLKIVLPEVIKKGQHTRTIQVAEDAVGIVLDSLRLLKSDSDASQISLRKTENGY